MCQRLRAAGSVLLFSAALTAGGCVDQTAVRLQSENERLTKELAEREKQVSNQAAAIEELNRQVRIARGFGPDDFKYIYYPDKISIERLSGGYDEDGRPGDDGVVVYLQPVDRDGDAVKVAGDIRIELYDLAAPPARNRLAVYEFPHTQIANLWYGKAMTYLYTLKCPWQAGPPQNPEITIRATFVDFITKRVMATQTTCTVQLR